MKTETRYRVASRVRPEQFGPKYSEEWGEAYFQDQGDLSIEVTRARMRLANEEQEHRTFNDGAIHPKRDYRVEKRTVTVSDWEEV